MMGAAGECAFHEEPGQCNGQSATGYQSPDQARLRPGESAMGKLSVTIGVGDQQGRRFEDIEVTVDTGSTFTAVPGMLLQNLGVPVARSARSRLADGSAAPVDIGWTMIRLEGQTFPTQVIFAEENQPSLLGVVALEQALLAVDPVGQQLVPVDVMRLYQGTRSKRWCSR